MSCMSHMAVRMHGGTFGRHHLRRAWSVAVASTQKYLQSWTAKPVKLFV